MACIVGLIAALAGVAGVAPSPYSSVQPGGVYELGGRVEVPPEWRRDSGWLAFTAVRVRKLTYADWLVGRLDPAARVVTTDSLRPDGMSDREYYASRARLMESSKSIASVLALRKTGLEATIGGRGALVERVLRDTPAYGKLLAGDVILAVDGEPTTDSQHFGQQVRRQQPARELTLEVLRDERRTSIPLTAARAPSDPNLGYLGVRTSTYIFDVQLPFPLELESYNVIGPSAGLMFSLAIVDVLTPGDLAGGRRVAGTGTIALDGRVGPIGSVAEKVVAAERDRAGVFLVPRENADEAARAARTTRVIPVESLDGALEALRELGGGLTGPTAARL